MQALSFPPPLPNDSPADGESLLAGLNPAQRAAVAAVDGAVLVLAGAGTGKTKVLITRLAQLLLTGRASPFEIMAVTFTNKAAREIQERVAALVGGVNEGWFLGTFHALAARILRKHAERIGLKPSFTILDDDDQQRLIKQILEAEKVDTKRTPPRLVLAVIQRWKDRGLLPATVPPSEIAKHDRYLGFYQQYQARLQSLNACDFGDLLLHNVTLLQNHADLRQEYQRRFKYILVDEYQDTNVVQYLWLRLLALGTDGQAKNICCVGDEDQSIYGWRGAEIGNILRFAEDFPGARTVRLEQNYRSTGHILAAASALIANNQDRLGKTLWTQGEMGEKITIQALWDGPSEARFVGECIETAQRHGTRLGQMAVLVRAGFQTREFEERLLNLGVPYKVIGGPRFYERQEIRDALAYLRLLVVAEDDLAFERIINLPKRGVGTATVQLIHQKARAVPCGMLAATRLLLAEGAFKAKMRLTLLGFVADYDRWHGLLDAMPHPRLTEQVLEESGMIAMLKTDKSPEAAGRLDNLKELITAMAQFDTLQGFMEHVSLVMTVHEDTASEQVTLMTLHAAKGLEFDSVFLPGWEEEIFPSRRSLEENGMRGLEEERRLAYVGLTRARKQATISHVANRLVYGSWTHAIPSRFIAELPEENSVRAAEAGLFTSPPHPTRFIRTPPPFSHAAPYRPKPTLLEANAETVAVAESSFSKNERVFHQKFGGGTVVAVEGNKLEVAFDQAGTKKIIADFVLREAEV